MICKGLAAAVAVNVNDCVEVCGVGVVESVTLTANVKEPAVVGVPESIPVLERLRPAGKIPEPRDQLYGAVPPDAANEVEYAVPT